MSATGPPTATRGTFLTIANVLVRLLDTDWLSLPRRERLLATVVIVGIGLAGLYVGHANERFVTCREFERVGDYVPGDCAEHAPGSVSDRLPVPR